MTCQGCVFKVQSVLSSIPGITNVEVDLPNNTAKVSMDHHVPTAELQAAFAPYPKYGLTEENQQHSAPAFVDTEDKRSFVETYKPVLLLFGYILVVSLLVSTTAGFDWMLAMRVFMAGFFLAFSFFKLLNLQAFADSYAMYDVVARRFKAWGIIYAFVELGLGIAYVVNYNPVVVNIITLLVMGVSIIGVLQSVLNKKKIQCACLGSVFNLPMSTLTIIEDAVMILMSAAMLVAMI